jgi:hypothetical protein
MKWVKTKVLSWCVISSFTVAIPSNASENTGDPGLLAPSGRFQTIQLSDGTRLTFLGTTTGKRHVAPHFENLSTGNWLYTGGDATVAWILAEHEPSRWPNYELLVSDKANTGCVNTEKRSSSHVRNGADIQGFVLNAFPRWDAETVLRIRPFGGTIAPGEFTISNADHGPLPDWMPEPMPDTKSDGDFQVTLTNLVAGAPLPRKPDEPVPEKDPANQCVRIAFGFQQNGLSVTNWNPRLVKTSDPAGNLVSSAISPYPQGGLYVYPHPGNAEGLKTDGYFYRPGLWPGVPAWKVSLEFTRTSGFLGVEILTLTNLAVRAGTQQEADEEWTWDESKTNFTFTAATINGVRMKVLPPLLVPDRFQAGQSYIQVIIYAEPNPTLRGMRLTLLAATDEQGRPVESPFPPDWAGHFSLDFPNPNDTRTLDLKLALYKSRFVEFTVKPASE